MKRRLSLGLDLSTQSFSAVVLDIDARTKIAEHSLDYVKDARLNTFGIRAEDYILPPGEEGEADQPPEMFLAALDAMFSDLRETVPLENVAIINTSAQQHGHVYLNAGSRFDFGKLRNSGSKRSDLVSFLRGSLACNRAPIWMTSNTSPHAAAIRQAVGGKERLIRESGSDAQLRFTGVVIRRTAERFPEVYDRTCVVHLISSLVPAVLTGDPHVPVDFGNACGMCLMDYTGKRWSLELLTAVSEGLPGFALALGRKLPFIVAPDSVVGKISSYFVSKYGFGHGCRILAGSGDNPQSKVLVGGDLLSLGSSFVNMVSTDGKTLDMTGAACAMYDGVGRPFMFGCRTNGALVWDRVRALYGLGKEDYAPAEAALQHVPPGRNLVFWQPRDESFPPSGSFQLTRIDDSAPDLQNDYAGIVESALAAVYCHSRAFSPSRESLPLYVMGGATGSAGIMRRVAAVWNRPVVVTEKAGAALGAAVAGISAFLKSEGEEVEIEQLSAAFLKTGETVLPTPEDTAAFHGPGGYLQRFETEEAKLLRQHPPS